MRRLTVYYDGRCGFCCATRDWIERQPQLVKVECLPATQPGAELTVIADTGEIWEGDSAWIVVPRFWLCAYTAALTLGIRSNAPARSMPT